MPVVKVHFLFFFIAVTGFISKSATVTYVVAAAGGNYTTIATAYAACTTGSDDYIIEIRTTGGTPYANAEAKPITLAANR